MWMKRVASTFLTGDAQPAPETPKRTISHPLSIAILHCKNSSQQPVLAVLAPVSSLRLIKQERYPKIFRNAVPNKKIFTGRHRQRFINAPCGDTYTARPQKGHPRDTSVAQAFNSACAVGNTVVECIFIRSGSPRRARSYQQAGSVPLPGSANFLRPLNFLTNRDS